MRQFVRGVLLGAAILALSAGSALAQTGGSIFGKVTDASGGVLPGVTVTVSGPTLQQPLVGTTQSSGAYQFPTVPIGTYTVTFELASFKKATRPNVVITLRFNAEINQALEIGALSEEMTITAAAPVVDTKKTTTGATFSKDILENIPTARDPWQIINMTPGVQAGLNVGGSSSGQQVGLSIYGTGANVQWNLEGGSITDLSSNSSPAYFNFDSFEQIQVVTGGGDVSIQSSGLSINLVTKSGSNVFKGSGVSTFQNNNTQSRNVSEAVFNSGAGGFISGAPIKRITNNSIEYGGPIKRNRLWFWAAADHQDINAGVLNFFDRTKGGRCAALAEAQRTGTLAGSITYAELDEVQDCLFNDKTLIKNKSWKFNYQLNAANKLQWLFQSDNKIRNSRGASSSTAIEAATRQFSPSPWKYFPLPTHSLTHTWVATDKLVLNNQYTYLGGGFSLDFQDYTECGESNYNGSDRASDYNTNANCMWNTQQLVNRTTGFRERSLINSYQTIRQSHELKTDGTYFMTDFLGGDHSLKFGLGYRKNPILSFLHYGGGAFATVQCVGNSSANCGNSTLVPVGAATGLVAYSADLSRDVLRNNNWWSYNGYIQDSYSRGKLRINGGLRWDWQRSTYLGGCVPANVIRPDLLPAQCEDAIDTDPTTGRKLPSFNYLSPRISATYDLFGNGKTSLHASGSYYYQTRVTLADSIGGLIDLARLTYTNASSGAPGTSNGWVDSNLDGIVQASELRGTPAVGNPRFDLATGILRPAGNIVDPSTELGRTREVIVGVQHELIPNLAVGVDYVYRKYDNGLANYTIGYQPGGPNPPLTSLYTGPFNYTDPVTGFTGEYFIVCPTCVRPSGLGQITVTRTSFETYNGLVLTANKRFSGRWQLNGSLTLQDNPNARPLSSVSGGNPTGRVYQDGYSTIAKYLFKLTGSYALPWGITASVNWNWNEGAVRVMSINGPGSVPNSGGLTATGAAGSNLNYGSLNFEPVNARRFESTSLLDAGVHKTFSFSGGKYRVKVMGDAFNITNQATILGYSSNNLSLTSSTRPADILPPRVFRMGVQVFF